MAGRRGAGEGYWGWAGTVVELGCWDGKEVVVVGVTSGRASAGARAGRERGEPSSWDGYREEEPEGDEPREGSRVGMWNGPVRGQRMVQCGNGELVQCGDGEGSGESPVWGQERVRCEDGEESTMGMVKGPVWGQRMAQCGNGEGSGVQMGKGSSVGMGNNQVWGWGNVHCRDGEGSSEGTENGPVCRWRRVPMWRQRMVW